MLRSPLAPEELNEGAGSLQLVHPYYSAFFCYVSNCLTDQELRHNGLAGSPIQFVSKNGRLSLVRNKIIFTNAQLIPLQAFVKIA